MRLLFLIFVVAFGRLTTHAQVKKIEVSSNINLEVINALTIPLYPEMLQDSVHDPWLFNNTQLMRVANNYFEPFYDHIAIKKSKNLIDKLGTGIYLLALYYEDLPKIKRKFPVPEMIWTEVSKNRDSALIIIDDFFTAASAFYRASNFEKFQSSFQYIYKQSISEVNRNLPDERFIPVLEQYYGDTKSSYNIIVMPFFKSDWGMGWEIANADGSKNIYNITSPLNMQVVENGHVKAVGYDNADKISNLSIHEFGHSFVNTVTATEPFSSQIAGYNHLYRQIESEKQYSDWQTLFNEHVVRAGEILVMRRLGKNEFADRIKAKYKDWLYLDFFLAQMTTYTKDRKRFPSFKAFLPVLIKNLQTLSVQKR